MNQTGDTIINLTDSDTNTNTWRDVVDGLDSTRTDASLSANQGRVLNGKFASYLPLSGGDMTGDITFNGHGASTIGSGSQDGAGLDAKNNLNIASWYGVSFTSKCAGFAYSDKPGVSIDCRNGTLAVAGAIYANGGVVGDLTGNAKTATTANSANSAKYINYSINKYVTGDSMKTPYWRFATIEVSSDWYDQSVILLVNTGCVGGGFGIIKLSVRSNQISNTENAYCEFSWLVRRGFDPNQFIVKGYSASKTTNYFDIYFKATGVYQGITVTVLSSGSRGDISFDWKLTNDEPRAAMDLRTYNYELVSSDEGVVNYANSAGSTTKWGAAINDISTQNGSDTWLLVMSADNKVQHRLSTDFATAGHSHGLTHRDLIAAIDTASGGWDLIGGNNGFILKSIRTNASAPKWTIDNFSAAIAFGGADTKGIITIPYNYPGVKFAGGNGDSPRWYFDISGTNEKSYNLDSFLTSHQDISGKLDKSGGTITGRIVKNTNGSWVGDRDRAVVYSMYPGDDSYGCVAGMPTKNGSWTMGNLGGVEHLIFNYVPDANYSANKNESIHVYLRPTEGTIALTSDIPTSLPASDVYAWAKASSKPSYSWSEINGRPTALSSFTNDSGYITGITKAMVTGALGYTPPTTDTNTTYSASTGLNLSGTSFSVKYGSTAGTACQGNDSRLSNSRPASDVYSWAKASSKPSYTWTEISNKPDIPSISHDAPTRTNWTIDSKYNCIVYRIGDFCLAVVAVTGTIYPRQWLPAAQLSKDFTPKTQSSIIISSVGGSDHMECMVTTDGYIKMWWSGSSPATSANICVPYYMG